MTPLEVQRRRVAQRAAGRRRPGSPGRAGADATPRLFPDDGMPAPFERPSPRATPAWTAGSEPDGRREGPTLEALIGGLWDEFLTEGRGACPLCGGEIVGRASAHPLPTEGRCRDCGTTLG